MDRIASQIERYTNRCVPCGDCGGCTDPDFCDVCLTVCDCEWDASDDFYATEPNRDED